MAWHMAAGLECAAEMRALAGGSWDAIENALYLQGLLEKAREAQRVVDRNASAVTRAARSREVREWKENAKGRVVAARCCPVCRAMYVYTAYDKAHGRHVACSSHCRHLHRSGWQIIRIAGEANTLFGWSKRFGITEAAVRYRIKKGWSVERAITTPAIPPGERRRSKLSEAA